MYVYPDVKPNGDIVEGDRVIGHLNEPKHNLAEVIRNIREDQENANALKRTGESLRDVIKEAIEQLRTGNAPTAEALQDRLNDVLKNSMIEA